MANYKLTDTDLTAVANAIRAKGGTSSQLEWPSGYISAINAIPTSSGPDIVSWSTGTDEQIAAMVAALDDGTLTIAETGWQIGDERTVRLAAMEATGVGETHAEQDVTFVLMDSQHYNLVGGGKDHFVVGMKDSLKEAGYMNSTGTSSGGWNACARRTWCNNVFMAAIPATLRACFKQFECVASNGGSSQIITSNDYFALFAEKEIIGSCQYSAQAESDELSQIEWYKTNSHLYKKKGTSNYDWYQRSPRRNDPETFCMMQSNGTSGYSSYANYSNGISPFGCI